MQETLYNCDKMGFNCDKKHFKKTSQVFVKLHKF